MTETLNTQCCIVGGGPAGMMLGFLLARKGVDVIVLEKHADFLRDFRGDTVHPSTLDVIYELGLLDEFLRRPHQEVREISGQVGNETVTIGDFSHLPTHCRFVVLMPQWDFLNFIAEKARSYSAFHLRTQAEGVGLIEDDGRIIGVRAKTPDGALEIHAGLTIGADGRRSVVRERAKLEVMNLGAPMDVMWMRISRKPDDPGQTFGHVDIGKILVLLNREEYWQCAYVIPKGKADEIRGKGIELFREEILRLEPFLGRRVDELRDWDDVKLLTVAVDRLREWSRPGLLCIGDAAHAMSPIGGIGINLAIQDAVATANILGPKLLRGVPTENDLQAVQRRRMFPTRATQRVQLFVQDNVIVRVLSTNKPLSLPWPLKLLRRFPVLRRIPARIVGVGFRPEHVKNA
ncbi:MAG TPA: FAD-dependent oxidoreductase [Terriglobales bacterium]|jgi:2-polyprenyl-6-methoxyphenol hydroxylase-like FAD-dependent oxidoreductase|nr:FAD-dependent oxidoreductase [Terriglobales bacterium]